MSNALLRHMEITDEDLRQKIRAKEVCWAGNRKGMIYGKLNCSMGKRMKRSSRVFFSSVQEAEATGFRPCGHCLREAYQHWKDGLI